MRIEINQSEKTIGSRPKDKFGRALFDISTIFSLFGGFILLLIVSISVVSIVGRIFFSSPLMGDFELVEMGCAIAIFCFLPICHLKNGNVIVDFFTLGLAKWRRKVLDGISGLLYAFIAMFFSWRMIYGAGDMFRYNEQTMLLKLPVWIAFIPGVFSFFLLSVACFYTFYTSLSRLEVEG